MTNLFELAELFLYQPDLTRKLDVTHYAYALIKQQTIDVSILSQSLPVDEVKFGERPILLPPKQMPRRQLSTPEGIAAFFHAIAHIECMAISLAWDMLYRFRGLPNQFYLDWLIVAQEEAEHFELIQDHLLTMGIRYGDLPAHGGLWEHAVATANDLLGRLAIVPRCLEARGLDVTPELITRFKALGDEVSAGILQRIFTDEIGHVAKGSFWFNYLCNQQELDPQAEFKSLLSKYYLGGKPKGPFNRLARLKAGFCEQELDWLESQNSSKSFNLDL